MLGSIVGAVKLYRLAVNDDPALIRLMNTAQYMHKGALSSTVLPYYRVYFPCPQLQLDSVQCPNAGESLNNIPNF